jgi:pimeloyl-ACP methyl ester carboxylesterase
MATCLIERDDITDKVPAIGCPAILFHGTADVAIPMSRAEQLAKLLPGCEQLVRVEGAAHASNFTHADQVNGPLAEFVRKHG